MAITKSRWNKIMTGEGIPVPYDYAVQESTVQYKADTMWNDNKYRGYT